MQSKLELKASKLEPKTSKLELVREIWNKFDGINVSLKEIGIKTSDLEG